MGNQNASRPRPAASVRPPRLWIRYSVGLAAMYPNRLFMGSTLFAGRIRGGRPLKSFAYRGEHDHAIMDSKLLAPSGFSAVRLAGFCEIADRRKPAGPWRCPLGSLSPPPQADNPSSMTAHSGVPRDAPMLPDQTSPALPLAGEGALAKTRLTKWGTTPGAASLAMLSRHYISPGLRTPLVSSLSSCTITRDTTNGHRRFQLRCAVLPLVRIDGKSMRSLRGHDPVSSTSARIAFPSSASDTCGIPTSTRCTPNNPGSTVTESTLGSMMAVVVCCGRVPHRPVLSAPHLLDVNW